MVLPTKQRFFNKFLLAIIEDTDVRNDYFERFGITHALQTPPEQIWCQLVDKLSNYGGYEIRRKLVEAVTVNPEDRVLDIGPEMGMECFLLAEAYNKVLVAEPDVVTADLLREIAMYYYTEDGRKASEALDIRRAGIIPAGSTMLATNPDQKPSSLVSFDARGAKDISETFGLSFADRVVCHHISVIVPSEPKLSILLSALSSYCKQGGTITWCDELSELAGITVDYARYKNPGVYAKTKYYKSVSQAMECSPGEIRKYVRELLPDFKVKFRVFSETGQLLTIAQRY